MGALAPRRLPHDLDRGPGQQHRPVDADGGSPMAPGRAAACLGAGRARADGGHAPRRHLRRRRRRARRHVRPPPAPRRCQRVPGGDRDRPRRADVCRSDAARAAADVHLRPWLWVCCLHAGIPVSDPGSRPAHRDPIRINPRIHQRQPRSRDRTRDRRRAHCSYRGWRSVLHQRRDLAGIRGRGVRMAPQVRGNDASCRSASSQPSERAAGTFGTRR